MATEQQQSENYYQGKPETTSLIRLSVRKLETSDLYP